MSDVAGTCADGAAERMERVVKAYGDWLKDVVGVDDVGRDCLTLVKVADLNSVAIVEDGSWVTIEVFNGSEGKGEFASLKIGRDREALRLLGERFCYLSMLSGQEEKGREA